ncbi:MAG: hypothetical protein LBQ64_06905, partial [Bacteroidales bacterium]|nr:hypothetical protein [Bacteroidales bacterium]
MYTFTISPNKYLSQNIQAFYHTDYVGYRQDGNPDYINTLKNTFGSEGTVNLQNAANTLRS